MKIKAGTILFERYEILEEIGEGGFGWVFRGFDKELNRPVAIKILKDTAGQLNANTRFNREAKLLAQLSHNNIVSAYSFHLLDSATPFIVMEYLEGQSLNSLVKDKGKLKHSQIMEILVQICEGLSHAHKLGIVHRDLSSANIFLTGDSSNVTAKILDFGLASIFCNDTGHPVTLTATGIMAGNPAYMSPEVVSGHRADDRSDIYALGCIIYECLTGQGPFLADDPVAYLYMHQNVYPKKPITIGPEEELLAMISLRCLQKEPSKRFQNCQEMIDLLKNGITIDTRSMFTNIDPWGGPNAHRENRRIAFEHYAPIIAPAALLIVALICWLYSSGQLFSLTAQMSLRNTSDQNIKYWLDKSDELKSQGKLDTALKILSQIELLKGKLDGASIAVSLAQEKLANHNYDAAGRLAEYALCSIGSLNKRLQGKDRKKLEQVLDQAAAIMNHSHPPINPEVADALTRIISQPNLMKGYPMSLSANLCELISASAAKMKKTRELLDTLEIWTNILSKQGKTAELVNNIRKIALISVSLFGPDSVEIPKAYIIGAVRSSQSGDKGTARILFRQGSTDLNKYTNGSPRQFLNFYQHLIELCLNLDQLNDALKYHTHAEKLLSEVDVESCADFYLLQYKLMTRLGRKDEALKAAYTSLDILRKDSQQEPDIGSLADSPVGALYRNRYQRMGSGGLNIRMNSATRLIEELVYSNNLSEALKETSMEIEFFRHCLPEAKDKVLQLLDLRMSILAKLNKSDLLKADMKLARELK